MLTRDQKLKVASKALNGCGSIYYSEDELAAWVVDALEQAEREAASRYARRLPSDWPSRLARESGVAEIYSKGRRVG